MLKDNSGKIILDLCGGTGAWSKPYKDAGYDVRVITLPEYDVTQVYPFNGIATNSLKAGKNFPSLHFGGKQSMNIEVSKIYGILCAPPCTEFSKAKSTAPRDFHEGMRTVQACLEIIWYVQKHQKLAFWVLENPVGLLRRFLGNPPYSFYQWQFGNDRNKHTDLWGRFREPKPTVLVKPDHVVKSAHNKNADWYSNTTAKRRAITPEGFAKAFFKMNK